MQFGIAAKCGIVAVGLSLCAGAARADIYQYSYTGKTFNEEYSNLIPPYGTPIEPVAENISTNAYVNYFFTTDSVLSPDTTYELTNYPSPNSTVLDSATFFPTGPGTITVSNTATPNFPNPSDALLDASVTTNDLGAIGTWNFGLQYFESYSDVRPSALVSCGPGSCLGVDVPGFSGSFAGDLLNTPIPGGAIYDEVFSVTAGTWSGPVDLTTVPEPASLTILAGGAGALAFLWRRKKASPLG